MKRTDGLRIALASLIENPLRTFLTLLGIMIGVMAVIFVVSVIQGLNGYIADTIGDLGPNVFVINRVGIIKDAQAWAKAIQRNKRIHLADALAVRRQATLVDKVAVSARTFMPGGAKYRANTAGDLQIAGVSVEYLEIRSFAVAQGRSFTPVDQQSCAMVCFLGADIADQLFGHADPLGKKISLMGRRFTVIGVAERKGSALGQPQDNFAMVPITTFNKIHGMHGSIFISCRSADPRRMDEAIDEVRSIMRARHHLRYKDEDDFGIVSSGAIMDFWREMTAMIFNVAIFVVSISLVVGGIVIMNIMLLTVVERTREIGVRKAIGASSRNIRFQFLAESVMVCALGGLLGVAMGWAATWLVRALTPLPARFPLWAPLLAVAVTSAVGIFFGIHPARKAARLDPIEALRTIET